MTMPVRCDYQANTQEKQNRYTNYFIILSDLLSRLSFKCFYVENINSLRNELYIYISTLIINKEMYHLILRLYELNNTAQLIMTDGLNK